MKKAVYALMLLAALPAMVDEAVAVVPQADSDPTALILFDVGFVGMIAGFIAYIWKKERARNCAAK